MLVNEEGDFQGMLAGGCLEGDLAEHSRSVITSGVAEEVTYDLRADDDVFGFGVGCEGALRILIQPLNAVTRYEPFSGLIETHRASTGHRAYRHPDALVESRRS